MSEIFKRIQEKYSTYSGQDLYYALLDYIITDNMSQSEDNERDAILWEIEKRLNGEN